MEVHWDRKREPEYAIEANWYAYLAQQVDAEPVGFRYMARLATTLYFELSMTFAAPTFVAGAAVIAARRMPESISIIISVSIVLIGAFAAFFLWQASSTHRVLCKTRRELNKRLSGARK